MPPKSPAVRAPWAARTARRNFRCCGVPKAAGSFAIFSRTRRHASASGSEASSTKGLSSFASLVSGVIVRCAVVSGVTVASLASASRLCAAVAVSALVPCDAASIADIVCTVRICAQSKNHCDAAPYVLFCLARFARLGMKVEMSLARENPCTAQLPCAYIRGVAWSGMGRRA